MRGRPDLQQYYRPVDETLPFSLTMNRDADAERCRFVCGYLACDARPFNPLLASLPLIVRAPVSAQSREWMAGLLDAAVDASGSAGAGREAMLAKLAELMFVEALRAHLEGLPADARRWVAGLRDPHASAVRRTRRRPRGCPSRVRPRSHEGVQWWWLRWGRRHEVVELDLCEVTESDGLDADFCLLPGGHPGPHSFDLQPWPGQSV
jgi:hypothetical protein